MDLKMDPSDQLDMYHYNVRKKLVERWPTIRNFAQSRDPSFVYVMIVTTVTQLFIATYLSYQPTSLAILFTIVVGPLYNFASFAMFHEACHDAAFPRHWPRIFNDILLMFANFPLAAGFVAPFYHEHRAHHAKLGTNDDLKYPSVEIISKFDRNKITRALYLLFAPLLYLYRLHEMFWIDEPKSNWWKWINRVNHCTMIIFVWSLQRFFGTNATMYLIGSVYLNFSCMYQGLKNQSDHAVGWDKQTHSFSSYDRWNLVNANIGHHREHHDFPSCPGRYLPIIGRIAKEFYWEEDEAHWQQTFYSNTIKIFNSNANEGLTRLSPKI